MPKKAPPKPEEVSVPLSSMIDVVFLLLIYFILTQKPVVEDIHLQVDLPAPGAASASSSPVELLRIDVVKLPEDNSDAIARKLRGVADAETAKAIAAQERVYYHVNGTTRYEAAELKKYLRSVAEANTNTTILINCGPNAKHKKLITLLDMCNELGLTKLNIVDDNTVQYIPDPIEKRD